ncbi:MAG: DEAD/DEAH box helicase, partial [Opitutales bacterium]
MKQVLVGKKHPSTFHFGVPEAAAAAAVAESLLDSPNRIHLLLAESLFAAERWAEDVALFLRFAGDKRTTATLPFPEPVAEEPGEILDQTCDRLAVLAELAKRPGDGSDRLLVATTPYALLAPCPERASLKEREIVLRPGEAHDFGEIVADLAERLGYASEILCERPGEFAPRGGLLDVYPLNAAAPVRIDFFGDEIEEIREFDPTSQRSGELLGSVSIVSAEGVGETRGGFFEHLGETVTWILWEPDQLSQRFPKFFHQATELAQPPPCLQDALDRDGGNKDHFLGFAGLETDLGPLQNPDMREWAFETLENLRGEKTCDVMDLDRFESERVMRTSYLGQLARWSRQGYQIVISHGIDAERQRIHETIDAEQDLGTLDSEYLDGGLHAGFRLKLAKNETVLGIKGGPKRAGLVVATAREILGRDRSRRPGKPRRVLPKRASVDEALDFPELADGDYIVHVQHGICLYRGLSELEIRDRMEEVITVEFDDGIMLHVPLRESHLLSRYVGLSKTKPKLAKLGGKAWAKTRQAAELATLDLAADLLSLQALRDMERGFACDKDHDWQRDFEDAFPFTETPDQLTSIQAVKDDMENTRPMDRLLCGDVGFGKTEVALRAAFKAVMSGKQVAMLVPTTVLCQQHLNVFRERMADFPVVVEMLSRFRSPTQQSRITKAVAKGSVDVLIGTHRLLSRDVRFKDLGLLVIDEEQRFGVQQKEKLKRLREKVDVLTMSATPIPRTLYFALMGARALSAIETAPTNRLPIRTFVRGYSKELLKEAIDREMRRKGQVFYLHNRVKTIDKVAQGLQKSFPKLKIVVGHGQMDETELERIMTEFVAGQHDVLVCTTI